MIYTIKIDNVDVSNEHYDLKELQTFNSELDIATILVKNSRSTAYEPNLEVDITKFDGTNTEKSYYIIASDIATKLGISGLYQHEIQLVELTKKLEFYQDSRRSFTQPITGEKFTYYDVVETLRQTIPLEINSRVDDTRLFIIAGFATDPLLRTGLSKLLTIESTNFVFENKTLKEMLDLIFSSIGGIPRLVKDPSFTILTADFFNNFKTKRNNKTDVIVDTEIMNINQYGTGLDIEIANQHFDSAIGNFVYEPPTGHFKRLTGVAGEFTESTSLFEVNKPIYEISKYNVKVELQSQPDVILDITRFVFELEVYKNLDSAKPLEGAIYTEIVKNTALFYTFGNRTIEGFYRDFGFAQGNPINNIIQTALFDEFGLTFARDQFKVQKFFELEFQIEYECTFTSRNQVKRIDTSRININTNRIAGQSDKILSSERTLKKLFQTIQQTANADVQTVKRLNSFTDDFVIGDFTADDYVITTKETFYYPEFFKVKYSWTQNYQKLSDFLNLNAQIRLYDIPKTSYKRNLYYEEFIELHTASESNTSLINANGLQTFMNTFNNAASVGLDNPIRAVAFNNLDSPDYSGSIDRIMLPAIRSGGGNSINFYFDFNSPSVAGSQIKFIDNIIFPDKPVLKAVKYTDALGKVEEFSFNLVTNYDVTEPDDLPLVPNADVGLGLINSGELKFTTFLDISERLAMTYAIHIIPRFGNEKKFVIGEYLARRNNLIEFRNGVFPNFEILKGNTRYDLNDTLFVNADSVSSGVTYTITSNKLTLSQAISDKNTWVLRDAQTKEIVFAVNQNTSGVIVPITEVYFNFRNRQTGVSYDL